MISEIGHDEEIAYSLSSFLRVVRIENTFFIEVKCIRGKNKLGSILFWKRICCINDQNRAIDFMEKYI